MPTTRQRKVQEVLVQEISDILRRDLKDPRIGFVTITGAEVTADLRHARVFFSVLGESEQQETTTKALNRAAGFVRSEFARRAQMRFVPEIRFVIDHSAEQNARISELLERARQDEQTTTEPGESRSGTDSESK